MSNSKFLQVRDVEDAGWFHSWLHQAHRESQNKEGEEQERQRRRGLDLERARRHGQVYEGELLSFWKGDSSESFRI